MPESDTDTPDAPGTNLPEAAKRALAEARQRKDKESTDKIAEEQGSDSESGGPKGLEPTRYGDWERKGISYDF